MKLLTNQDLFNLINELSLRYFDKPFKHEATFNYRLRTTGGRYIPTKKVIEINPKYMVELEEEFIGIIKHELCHYHLHIEGRGYKHGDEEFKELLAATGSPRFCKPLPSNQGKYNYLYMCTECKSEYKRMRRVNTDKFRCGKCKGMITLT